jgi:hypothetical protein
MLLTTGYSGGGAGKNNPLAQFEKDIGPIPCGYYTIDDPIDTTEHGPYALPLIPDESNDMGGRSGFMLHGDSKLNPGHASEGCIIANQPNRSYVWQSNDHRLQVIP